MGIFAGTIELWAISTRFRYCARRKIHHRLNTANAVVGGLVFVLLWSANLGFINRFHIWDEVSVNRSVKCRICFVDLWRVYCKRY